MRMGQVDFYMIFPDIRVDPSKNLPLGIGEDHIFIQDEEPVLQSQRAASICDGSGISLSPF